MDNWKFYKVICELTWFNGGDYCDAELTMKIHAKSPGHAISRVKDRLAKIGTHEVEEATAIEEKI